MWKRTFKGLAIVSVVVFVAGPGCAQGSSALSPDEAVGSDSGSATVEAGVDAAVRHDAATSDSSVASDTGGSPDAGEDATAPPDASVMQPDAGQPDTGTVQPDASTGPTACPTDTIHSAEAAIELAKANPKTCLVPAQCGPGECCFVPLVCIPL